MRMRPDIRLANFAHVAVVLLLGVRLAPGTARAQGDGPHNLPVIPVGMNLFVVMPMGLSGNFNPSQTVLIPGASRDVIAVPITYIRTFSLGSRFGRLFVTAPLATGAGQVGKIF